jgi:hypothetical protein
MLRALHRDGLDLSASIAPSDFPEPMRAEVTSQCWLRQLTENEKIGRNRCSDEDF